VPTLIVVDGASFTIFGFFLCKKINLGLWLRIGRPLLWMAKTEADYSHISNLECFCQVSQLFFSAQSFKLTAY